MLAEPNTNENSRFCQGKKYGLLFQSLVFIWLVNAKNGRLTQVYPGLGSLLNLVGILLLLRVRNSELAKDEKPLGYH